MHHLSLLPYKRTGRQTRSTISIGPDCPRSWVKWIATKQNCSKSQATPKTSMVGSYSPLQPLHSTPCSISEGVSAATPSADLGLSLYYFCRLVCWPEILFYIPFGPCHPLTLLWRLFGFSNQLIPFDDVCSLWYTCCTFFGQLANLTDFKYVSVVYLSAYFTDHLLSANHYDYGEEQVA